MAIIEHRTIINVALKVQDSGDGVLAEDIYRLPAVKQWFVEQVGSSSSPGKAINPRTLHFKDDSTRKALLTKKFNVSGLSQSNFIKDAANFDKYAGTIETFQLIISRRQTRKLATLTGVCKKYPTRDVVYHVSKDVKKNAKKTKGKVKKQWIEILGK